MHVISKKRLDEFVCQYPEASSPLYAWYQVVKRVDWIHFADLRDIYASADAVGEFVVFNIGGNKYRLIAHVHYAREGAHGTIFVRHVLTHKEYDRGRWRTG